jgi:hypothetical protein
MRASSASLIEPYITRVRHSELQVLIEWTTGLERRNLRLEKPNLIGSIYLYKGSGAVEPRMTPEFVPETCGALPCGSQRSTSAPRTFRA